MEPSVVWLEKSRRWGKKGISLRRNKCKENREIKGQKRGALQLYPSGCW